FGGTCVKFNIFTFYHKLCFNEKMCLKKEDHMTTHVKQSSITAFLDFMRGGSSAEQLEAGMDEVAETKKYEEYKEVESQIRDKKVQLKNSREKVAHLEQSVKSIREDKYKSEKQLITQLQEEQRRVLSKLNAVRESKYQLIRNAGVEMDRLRSIVRILQEQLQSIQSGVIPYDEGVSPQTVTNYMQYNSDNHNLKFLVIYLIFFVFVFIFI
ncbi:hypothetical protein RFI_10287, partial [Reticulomyxa filosa]